MRFQRLSRWLLFSVGISLVMLLSVFRSARAGDIEVIIESDETTTPVAWEMSSNSTQNYANCRFGLGFVGDGITQFDYVPNLNLGWYLNWGSRMTPVTLPGMEYAQMIRTRDGLFPTDTELTQLVQANEGALWLIGNEPDSPVTQDNLLPEEYATRYHRAYTVIKSVDPTARVAVGGIIQPTPIRLQYLDLVLQAYRDQFGSPLRTDAWHIHSFILREISAAYAAETGLGYWGAEIPPGVDVPYGEIYDLYEDTDDLDIFEARLRDFRQWMRERGYRNTPLLISEYGTLVPYYGGEYLEGFDEPRAADFMTATFDVLLSATDPQTGYPADNNRLVQRWVWYSSHDDQDFGGALFNSTTKQPRMLAHVWHTYTSAISPTVDLVPVDLVQVHVPFSTQELVTATVRFRVSNAGNIALTATEAISISVLGNEVPLAEPLQITGTLRGCAGTQEFVVDWPDLSPGVHQLRVEVDPVNMIDERDETNNVGELSVLVATNRLFIPLVLRQ